VTLENELCYEHVLKFVEASNEHQKCKLTEAYLTINRTKESMIIEKKPVCQYTGLFISP